MKIYKRRFFESNYIFKDTVLGTQSGQIDQRLLVYDNSIAIGFIDYTNYKGEISIKIIEVLPQYRNKGIGEQLVLHLQKLYPKTEIGFGMLTDDGNRLYNKVKNKMFKDTAKEKEKLALIKKYKDIETAIKTAKIKKEYDKLNDLNDELAEIENILYYDYDYFIKG